MCARPFETYTLVWHTQTIVRARSLATRPLAYLYIQVHIGAYVLRRTLTYIWCAGFTCVSCAVCGSNVNCCTPNRVCIEHIPSLASCLNGGLSQNTQTLYNLSAQSLNLGALGFHDCVTLWVRRELAGMVCDCWMCVFIEIPMASIHQVQCTCDCCAHAFTSWALSGRSHFLRTIESGSPSSLTVCISRESAGNPCDLLWLLVENANNQCLNIVIFKGS